MQETDIFLDSLKESLNIEKEYQNLIQQNELLKSQLYSKTLDQKDISLKIDSLKDSISNEQIQKEKSIFVEKIAEWIFKFNNLGVADSKSAIEQFVKDLCQQQRCLSLLEEKEFF